jgi:hypothetical protein
MKKVGCALKKGRREAKQLSKLRWPIMGANKAGEREKNEKRNFDRIKDNKDEKSGSQKLY